MVFFLDYIGALLASLSFPLLLLPHVGMLRSVLILAFSMRWSLYGPPSSSLEGERLRIGCVCIAFWYWQRFGAAYAFAGTVESKIDADLFADPVVLSKRSPYQKLTVTRRDGDTRLFINGALQFFRR